MDINPSPKACAARVWLVSKSVWIIARKHLCTAVLMAWLVSFVTSSASAQVLTNTWTLAGGGLNPTNYGNNFRPATLVSDTGSTGTASIGMSGLTNSLGAPSGGLGSSGLGAYGGIYSFFSSGLNLNLQATNISAGLSQITLRFLAGGGSPALSYSNSSLTLNYNPTNLTVASSSFSAVSSGQTNTPVGLLELTNYTWSWTNLSLLGSASAFSIAWRAPVEHAFITDISLTQTVPEPSVFVLLALGVACCFFMRRARKTN